MKNWDLSDWGVFLLVLLMATVVLAMLFDIFVGDKFECADLSKADSVHDYNWTFFTGCRVKTPLGYWIAVDDAKLLEIPDGSFVPIE